MIDRGPVTIGGHCGSCEHFSSELRHGYGVCRLLNTSTSMAFGLGPTGFQAGDIAVRPSFGCTQWFPASEEALAERDVTVTW